MNYRKAVNVPPDVARRVGALLARIGVVQAGRLLRVSQHTLEEARTSGALHPKTIARITDALDCDDVARAARIA